MRLQQWLQVIPWGARESGWPCRDPYLWISTSPVVRYGRVKEEDKILGEEALFSEETISGEGHISEPPVPPFPGWGQ